MDEFVRKAASIGLPAVLLLVVMATTGLFGAAAITTALAMLGGPAGMLGGLVLLGIVGIAGDMLSKFGLEALLSSIYEQRSQNGESRTNLCNEIDGLPISGDLRRSLKEKFGCR